MSGSNSQLHDLYRDLGDAYVAHGRSFEAADAYALALYYAKLMNAGDLVQHCRELVAAQNPRHVAAREGSAPLLFAQLLMRYPADEAEQIRQHLRRVPTAVAAPPVGALAATHAIKGDSYSALPETDSALGGELRFAPGSTAESFPEFTHGAVPAWEDLVASTAANPTPLTTDQDSIFAPLPKPAASPTERPPIPSEPRRYLQPHPLEETRVTQQSLETHHPYDLRDASSGVQAAASFVTDDLIVRHDALKGEDFMRSSATSSLLNLVAGFMVLVGMGAVGFFGYEVFPTLQRLDLGSVMNAILRDAASWTNPEGSDGQAAEVAEPVAHRPASDVARPREFRLPTPEDLPPTVGLGTKETGLSR